MKNKEDKYRSELFELFRSDLTKITDNENDLSLLNEIFITNDDGINNERLMEKLIKE